MRPEELGKESVKGEESVKDHCDRHDDEQKNWFRNGGGRWTNFCAFLNVDRLAGIRS